ncbi:MAG: hypothetical protein ACOVQ7_26475, partial [Limnoraphis robusta]
MIKAIAFNRMGLVRFWLRTKSSFQTRPTSLITVDCQSYFLLLLYQITVKSNTNPGKIFSP